MKDSCSTCPDKDECPLYDGEHAVNELTLAELLFGPASDDFVVVMLAIDGPPEGATIN